MVSKKFEECVTWVVILFILTGIFGYVFFPQSFHITGNAGIVNGIVGLTVLDPIINIFVYSPENTTYNFGIGADYIIDLNVSSDFIVNTWWYRLYDLRHEVVINESVIFTPNTTINAIRWSNLLTVYANHTVGSITSENITFFIEVPNSAPILGTINDSILICEDDTLSYSFNATDVDENSIISIDINPKDPFYVSPTVFTGGQTFIESNIISESFTKNDIGTFSEVISVSDQEYVDTKNINITVIEINNPPILSEIGAQTAWTIGDNTFYKELVVSDIENGGRTSGNLSFNLTFLTGIKFFDIDDEGVMNFTGNDSIIGAYDISVCVTDLAIEDISPNISLCGQDGLNQTTCKNFSLAVTDDNRAPTITSSYPTDQSFTIGGTTGQNFNISKYDPDGNIPDAYWYIDGIQKERDVGDSIDTFSYTFGCDVSGLHTASVVVSDGLLNDSLNWSITVTRVDCPITAASVGGGGGGGGAGIFCSIDWVCKNWDICQHNKISLEVGLITGENYREAKDSCKEEGLPEESCGVQIRDCNDLNSCDTNAGIPAEFQSCYFIEEPNCFDEIKNCHSNDCELLTDCGGPCKPCPTCSDKIKNQGEKGIDCGGPCPWQCVEKVPLPKKYYGALFWILLIILIIIVIIRLMSITKLKKELSKKTRRKKDE